MIKNYLTNDAKDLLSVVDISIIGIIDEYGTSTINKLSIGTYCKPYELIPHLNKLTSKKILDSYKDGGSVMYRSLNF